MNELYDGPAVAPEDILSVYVILNGSLKMSPGKCASQAFHCGTHIGISLARAHHYDKWGEQGRRVVVRVAETEHIFERVTKECIGRPQQDEGLTEVERGSVTAFVTLPYTRADAPKILTHKKCQLL